MGMIDNSGEGTATRFYLPAVTGANYDDVVGNGIGDNVGDLRIATAILTLCNYTKHSVTTEVYTDVGTLPSSPYAQRELKLLVRYIDAVNGKRSTLTIPGPDLSTLASPGTDIVDHVSNAVAAAWVAVFEANAASPDGNAVEVVGMQIVGRSV
jgi:hypothetical protein